MSQEVYKHPFCHGSFISYDDNRKVENPTEHQIKQRKYYTYKYNHEYGKNSNLEIKVLYDDYCKLKDGDKILKDKAYKKYHDAELDYVYEKYDLTDTFIKIGESATVCPYAFSDPTVKGMSYEHAGEVYMVVTIDAVYFETERHY